MYSTAVRGMFHLCRSPAPLGTLDWLKCSLRRRRALVYILRGATSMSCVHLRLTALVGNPSQSSGDVQDVEMMFCGCCLSCVICYLTPSCDGSNNCQLLVFSSRLVKISEFLTLEVNRMFRLFRY